MLTNLNRRMVAAIWTGAALGLYALFGSPLTVATGSLLLLAAVAPPTIMYILSSAPPLTLAQVINKELRSVDSRRER